MSYINYHMPATVAALESSKDVFYEKTMAGAYVDAIKMWETAQATGRKWVIQFATIFSNETKAARFLIDDGHLGDIYHVRSVGHGGGHVESDDEADRSNSYIQKRTMWSSRNEE